MTLIEAVRHGHVRVRKVGWAFGTDYVKLHHAGGGHLGPWGQLYSPLNSGGPKEFLIIYDISTDWEPYDGPRLEQ